MNLPQAFWIPLGAALVVGLIWVGSLRSERFREGFRVWYSSTWTPHAFRLTAATAPILALGMGLLSVVAIAPRWAQVWLAIAAFDVFLAAFAYSYVVPRRHLPAWLRSDIESGRIDEARPNRDDWLLFWMFMTLAVFLNVGGPALVLGFFKR